MLRQISRNTKKYIEWKDLPLHQEIAPVNSALHTILNLSIKCTSKLYSIMKEASGHVLDIAADKWNEKAKTLTSEASVWEDLLIIIICEIRILI